MLAIKVSYLSYVSGLSTHCGAGPAGNCPFV